MAAVLSRQSQFRRPHQFAGARELSGVAAAGGRLRAGRPRGHRSAERAARRRTSTAKTFSCATSGRRTEEVQAAVKKSRPREMFAEAILGSFRGRRALELDQGSDGRSVRLERRIHLHQASRRISTTWWTRRRPCSDLHGLRVLAMLGDSVTTDHISPAGNIPADSPAGKYLIVARREARRFQFLRRAARQSRSDGARHVRQHSAAKPDGARNRRRLDHARARRREDVHLRRIGALSEGRHAAADHRRQGVRLRIVARLGRQGHAAAGRARP